MHTSQSYENGISFPAARCFIPLFLCFILGGTAAFFLGEVICRQPYTVGVATLPSDSLLKGILTLARCLRSSVLQTTVVFLSAFAVFPSGLFVPVILYRGLCLGITLYGARCGLITGIATPGIYVILYFCETVLLILIAAMADRCQTALCRGGFSKAERLAILLSYLRIVLVIAGGIFALSAFTVLFC